MTFLNGLYDLKCPQNLRLLSDFGLVSGKIDLISLSWYESRFPLAKIDEFSDMLFG